MIKYFFSSLTIILLSYNISAQEFSNDREKFVKEFQKSLSEYGKGDYTKFAKDDLPLMLLETQDFPNDYFIKMVETANNMLVKKLKPYPEVYNYVFSVYSFVKAKQSKESYNAWHESVDNMLDARNIKKFEDFIEFSAGFFSQRRLSESPNFNWYFEGGTYTFKYDTKPSVVFKNGNLICRVENSKKDEMKDKPYIDSIKIYNTNGVYDPILKKWDGENGRITWEKVGIEKDKVYADFKKYDASMKSSKLTIDSVLLTSNYFTKPSLGKLAEDAFKINREEDKIYPQFISYERRLKIVNIRPDVNYEGGFSLKGDDFVGQGDSKVPAQITVMRNGKPYIKAKAQLFIINPKSISSNTCEVSLYFNENKDSLSHGAAAFTYSTEKKVVELLRTKTGGGQAPFNDSYHAVDMYVQRIIWEFDAKDVMLTYDFISQEQRVARLESINYYDGRLYQELQGQDSKHPLVALSQYAYKYDENTMTEGKAASALGKTIEQAKSQLLQLSSLGFINYDLDAQTVKINPKLENFVKARAGQKDFDNIIFISDLRPKDLNKYSAQEIKDSKQLTILDSLYKMQNEVRRGIKNYGILNLGTLELSLEAIDFVTISEPQNTTVFPNDKKVVLKKNRNFDFHGWVNSGKMEINVLTGNYVYADNKINLIKTDNSLFRIRPLREDDGKESIAMQSTINGITGQLLVDNPDNRSGLIKPKNTGVVIPVYPVLESKKPSFVYYNYPNLYRGAYDSTRFYYTVEPFTLDSLTQFKEKSFTLKGELTSAGIFPKFKQDLRIMPDYSFGFITKAPIGGYDFYGPKTKYDSVIILSNSGLQGAGTINFVASVSKSPKFVFLPDSTLGFASFVNNAVEKGVQFPDVRGEEILVTYIPKSNTLKAASTPKNDLTYFGGEAKLRGTAIIKPDGMTGNGLMTFNTASTTSKNYKFKRWDIDADTANFNLKNNYPEEGENSLLVDSKNLNTHISFKDRKGDFKSNGGKDSVVFPVNQYYCKMDQFSWDMDQEEIEFQSSGEKDISINSDLDLKGPNFFSMNPSQDGLQFKAPKANISLKEKTIYCSKVEYLDIADARIFPDSMLVTIRKKAKMDPFLNAKIVANYITKYHKFINSNLEITGRRAFSGSGEFPYYDSDSTKFLVKMDKIYVDSSFQTVATGSVVADAGFKLSKHFDYYGKVLIKAASPEIYFNGATRINHDCSSFQKNWLAFSAPIDPKNIQIPVSSAMKNLEGTAISAGIVWHDSRTSDSIRLYPTFLSSLESKEDIVSITANGFLQYSMDAKEFQIGSKEKLLNRNEPGNFLALHTESCSLNGEGVINLGMDYGDAPVDAVGYVNYNEATGKTEMNITARFNISIDKKAMEDAADRINKLEGVKPLQFEGTSLDLAVTQWVSREASDKLKSDFTIKGEVKKLPSSLETAFIVTGLKLISFNSPNFQERGLITETDNAYLVNFFEKPIMKQVPIKAFFQQTYSGAQSDKFGIWFNLPAGLDYYFDYTMIKKDGDMKILSGDGELNTALADIKDDKRKTKNFSYEVVNNRIYLSKFLRFFGVE